MKNFADKNAIARALLETRDETNKTYLVQTRGTSMLPFIKEGSEIVIQYARPIDIKVGDIIAFRRSINLVLHRVIGKHSFNGKVYFIEKGDDTFDTTIISEDVVIGKAVQMKGTNATIRLDQGFWAVINRIMGVYGYISSLIFDRTRFIKNKLLGERKTSFTTFSYKFFKTFASCVPVLLISIGHIFQRKFSDR